MNQNARLSHLILPTFIRELKYLQNPAARGATPPASNSSAPLAVGSVQTVERPEPMPRHRVDRRSSLRQIGAYIDCLLLKRFDDTEP